VHLVFPHKFYFRPAPLGFHSISRDFATKSAVSCGNDESGGSNLLRLVLEVAKLRELAAYYAIQNQ
jgi:hypothetical protein